jgi:hypothetical protein
MTEGEQVRLHAIVTRGCRIPCIRNRYSKRPGSYGLGTKPLGWWCGSISRTTMLRWKNS